MKLKRFFFLGNSLQSLQLEPLRVDRRRRGRGGQQQRGRRRPHQFHVPTALAGVVHALNKGGEVGGYVTGGSRAVSEPLLTLTEQVATAEAVARAVTVPVLCDAGAGFGEPLHVTRTVRGSDGKTHFARVHAHPNADGVLEASFAGGQGSHQLSAMAASNALAMLPYGPGVAPVDPVDLLLL